MRNISPIPPPSIAATVDVDRDIVLPTLEPALSLITLEEASRKAEEMVAQENAVPDMEKLSLKSAPKPDHKSPTSLELERLENQLRTIQLALEILTGVCATLPEPEQPELNGDGGEDGIPEDDEMDEEDLEAMDEDDSPVDSFTSKPAAFLPKLVEPLLKLVQPTALSFPPIGGGPSPHPPTTSVLSAIHICALECLNNVFLSLASPARGVNPDNASRFADIESVWDAIWSALATVGTEITGVGQENRRDMWQLAVGVLWGIGIVWKGLLVPSEEQIQILIQLCESTPDQTVKVKCIGTLECLAQHPKSIDANRIISTYLMSLVPSGTQPSKMPVEPLLQVLSALIDIYSDEDSPYDINFRQGKYIAALSASVEPVRKLVRGIDRKRERELKRRGEEVRDNLVAFLDYRRSLRL